jgi:xanthine dehydrogenase accessory factor
VANHARVVLDDGEPRRLLYGKGSPWIDIRLLCGGSLRLHLERIPYEDPAVTTLLELSRQRRQVRWTSDGHRRIARECNAASEFTVNDIGYSLSYDPPWRLVIVGGDPIALAIASLAAVSGFDTTIIRPNGPASSPPIAGVSYLRGNVSEALASIGADAWTAVVTATHDDDIDDAAILAAYRSAPAYVGVLGSALRLADRRKRLWVAGLREAQIASLHAPIGAARCGKAPWEVAASVIAEIMQTRSDRATFMVSAGSDPQLRAITLQNVHEP